jgi:hypothetical protein
MHLDGMESGDEARVGEQRSGGGRKVQRTWLWAAAASPGLASMGEGGMWWRLGETRAPGEQIGEEALSFGWVLKNQNSKCPGRKGEPAK